MLINRIEDSNLAPLVSGDLPSGNHLDHINSVRQTIISEKSGDLPDGAQILRKYLFDTLVLQILPKMHAELKKLG